MAVAAIRQPAYNRAFVSKTPGPIMLSHLKKLLLVCVIISTNLSLAIAGALDDIQERGSIRIGVSQFAPWTIKTSSGELKGFEIEVGNKIAEDMGVKADFKDYVWEDIIGALENGEIDMIAAGMAITPQRALRVDFSIPYTESGVTIAANTNLTQEIDSFKGLDAPGHIVLVVADTLAHDVTRTLFDEAEVRVFDSAEEAEAEMLKGEAHVYVASVPEARFLTLRNREMLDLPLSEPLIRSRAGLAVQRGNQELLNFLNAWVTARTADEWIDASYGYWFESLDWIVDTQ